MSRAAQDVAAQVKEAAAERRRAGSIGMVRLAGIDPTTFSSGGWMEWVVSLPVVACRNLSPRSAKGVNFGAYRCQWQKSLA
jgi:hypothetical protein